MKTRSILKQTVNCPLIPPDPGASLTARRLLLRFSQTCELFKVQKLPSQLCLSLLSIIITITSNEPWNRETHKTDRNPQITNHDLLSPWSKVLFPKRSVKMIDSSEKRNRRLGSELQNSHVCEKCDPNLRSTVYMKTHYLARYRYKQKQTPWNLDVDYTCMLYSVTKPCQ